MTLNFRLLGWKHSPDLRAEARDHTVLAAWREVVGELETLVRHRQDNRRQHADERRRIRPLARTL